MNASHLPQDGAQPPSRLFGALMLVAVVISCSVSAPAWGAERSRRPNLAGVWSPPVMTPDDPRWRIEDSVCMGLCPLAGYQYLQGLLRDPRNDDRPLAALTNEMHAYGRKHIADLLTPGTQISEKDFEPAKGRDPTLDCKPDGDGLRHQISAPLLFQIEQHDDRVVLRYEYWDAVRTVYLDGRRPPSKAAPTRLGHSIGRYEGSTLVVETTGIIPAPIRIFPSGSIPQSSQASAIERYTRSDDGSRLELELSLVDPLTFRQPLVIQSSWLVAPPDWKLDKFACDAS